MLLQIMCTPGDLYVPHQSGMVVGGCLPRWELPLKEGKIFSRLYFIKYVTAEREKPTLICNFHL